MLPGERKGQYDRRERNKRQKHGQWPRHLFFFSALKIKMHFVSYSMTNPALVLLLLYSFPFLLATLILWRSRPILGISENHTAKSYIGITAICFPYNKKIIPGLINSLLKEHTHRNLLRAFPSQLKMSRPEAADLTSYLKG